MSELVEPDDWLTPREAARLARVSTSTVLRAAARGELPAYRVGRAAIRIRRADFRAWLFGPEVGRL